jgi:hypothetical protein
LVSPLPEPVRVEPDSQADGPATAVVDGDLRHSDPTRSLVGLFALAALKIVIFVVIPIVLVVWLVRRYRKPVATV